MNKSTKDVAVVVVDMQSFFLKNVNHLVKVKLLKNQSEILIWSSKNKMPTIFLEYGDEGISRGKTNSVLINSSDGKFTSSLVKNSNSGFTGTNLDKVLNNFGVSKIILMGINANGCVQDTAIGAIRRNYQVCTADGIIANSHCLDMNLSVKNKKWYQENTRYFGRIEDLMSYFK